MRPFLEEDPMAAAVAAAAADHTPAAPQTVDSYTRLWWSIQDPTQFVEHLEALGGQSATPALKWLREQNCAHPCIWGEIERRLMELEVLQECRIS